MDFQNTDLQGGSLQISTEVIGKIARCAALEIDGVAEVSCGRQNKKLKEQMREQQERLRQYAHEYLLMGNECITQAHDIRAALANYDKALSLDPNYIDAWIRKGITLFNNKDYFDAENCFNTAVNLHPANFKAVYNRGKLRLKTENTEGAIADLDKATSLKPEHAGAHELFGDALLKAGKEVEAALQWRIAEELKKKKKQ
mgnify:CR=1 FL=1